MNKDNPMASFQLKEYHIQKLLLDQPVLEFNEEDPLAYFAHYKYDYVDNQWNGAILMGFRRQSSTEGEDGEKVQVTMQEAIVEGHFTEKADSSKESEEGFAKHLRINGASTLIPILRAAICSTSALMGYPGKYTLPNINTFSLSWDCDNPSEEKE